MANGADNGRILPTEATTLEICGFSGVFFCRFSRTEEQGDARRRPCEEPLLGAQFSGISEAFGAIDCCASFWVYWASGLGYWNWVLGFI
ncbi:hypothetical protein ES332_A12G124500v1 [Gossypium tomentosum]|uniref:Uncharacterized protein n=1 Tax=Gossypium tomentosum TaxID=34277 RepID=A0A5D2MVV3_GOSTO|nr:hypothetical protein ES332_A12G124500v1 [Gossypium tomentosum]